MHPARHLFRTTALGTMLAFAVMFPASQPLKAFAQANTETTEEEAEAPKREVRTLPPAYDSQMLKLAETLGSLHYLRELCGANEGQTWRDEMQKMLEAEEPTEERKAQLIAHFNRGFRGYREIHRECTPAAAQAANYYLRQGVRIATEIPNRFGR